MKLIGSPYTIHLLTEIFSRSRAWVACLFEFVDPLVSFIITGILMKRLNLFQTYEV
jgi:hypothetical protein